MSPLLLGFLESAFIPAVAVAVVCLAVGGLSEPWRARLQSLAFALGFVTGAYVLVRGLTFPPHDVNESFSWAALLLALFVWISPRPVNTRYLVRALFVVALGLVSLWSIRESLNGSVQMRNLLAFFFLALGTWSIVERAAQTTQTLTMIVLPLVSATALSLMLLFHGSASMSQIVSVVCTLLGAMAALVLIFPRRLQLAAILPFASAFVILFMVAGHFYLDINPWHMIYLCWPFLLLWIRGSLKFVPRQAIAETVILGLMAAAPLGYFLWTVFKETGPLY